MLDVLDRNELIPIEVNEKQEAVVSGRELHKFLEVGTAYKDWMPRMIEYGFVEDLDFCSILSESTGGRPSVDHILKLDMAKELSMIQRSEKGKQARQYFIQVEKDFNTPEKLMARALKVADETISRLNTIVSVKDQQLAEAEPKLEYYDMILNAKGYLEVGIIAQDYGMKAKDLNSILCDLGIQFKQNKVWLLRKPYIDKGYTRTFTEPYGVGNGCYHITKWTQKGRLFLYQTLKDNGYLPKVEQ